MTRDEIAKFASVLDGMIAFTLVTRDGEVLHGNIEQLHELARLALAGMDAGELVGKWREDSAKCCGCYHELAAVIGAKP